MAVPTLAKMRGRPDAPPPLENAEVERAILGAVLTDDRAWLEIDQRIAEHDFSASRHRLIYRGMQALHQSGRPILRALLLSQVAEWPDDDGNGLNEYIDRLRSVAAAPARLSDMIVALLHTSGRRRLIRAAEEIIDRAATAPLATSIEDVRAEAMRAVQATASDEPTEEEKFGGLVSAVIANAHDAATSGKPRGILPGLRCVADLIGPLLPGQLIVIGGETGAGKTALATCLAVLAAADGIPVNITSMEMEAQEIAARVLAYYANVSSERISTGMLNPAELDRMMRDGEPLMDLPLWINSQPRQTVGTMHARYSRAKARHGIALGVVDHLQFAKGTSRGSEHEIIRDIVDDCKAMAKRLQMPFILVSHVSRTTDPMRIQTASDIRRPMLTDLYGSSAIEKAADAVLFVHRPHWFLERATPFDKNKAQHAADLEYWQGKAELVVPKRRGGKGFGVRQCRFDEERTWFSDL